MKQGFTLSNTFQEFFMRGVGKPPWDTQYWTPRQTHEDAPGSTITLSPGSYHWEADERAPETNLLRLTHICE